MQVLKGAEVSAKIKEEVQGLLASVEGPAPKLAIVRVGERPDDMSYERGAIKKMENFWVTSPILCISRGHRRCRIQGAFRGH